MSVIRFDFKTNQEWRAERARSIGASAIGTILGVNPYTTPLELAQRMRSELNGQFDYTQTLAMQRGHAYESGVAALFEWQTGHQVIQNSAREYLLRRSDLPFMHASPDRTYWINPDGVKNGKNAEQNKGVLECKTTRRPVDPDDLPLAWVIQLQVQMGIGGYQQGFIAWDVLTNADGFGYRFFDFNADIFNTAVELCRDFWNNSIIGNQDPAPVNARDIISRYPTSISGKTLSATPDCYQLINDIKELKAAKKDLDTELDTLTDRLKAHFTDEEAMIDHDGHILATYKSSAPRTSIDSKRLQADFPDAYAACSKTSNPTRTLLIK